MKSRLLLILLALSWCGRPASGAIANATTPVLTIEAGMHTSTIFRIGTDTTGRLLLTASFDKTARLWELPSGRLLRTFRLPIGPGDEGKLYGCALSPDGALAAFGGFTGADTSGEHPVYIYDTSSGRMVQRIALDDAVDDLSFSKHGRYLAGVMLSGKGLRIWETTAWKEVARDEEYGGVNSNGVDWSGDGRLVTACLDGNIRLYRIGTGGDQRLSLIARAPVKGGGRPYNARFSPDGEHIAVGFDGASRVVVVGGKDLKFQFSPDTTGVVDSDFLSLSWSDDGEYLYGGGRYQQPVGDVSLFCVRRWRQGGRGNFLDIPVSGDTIMDVRALPGGQMVYGTAEPCWGFLNPEGKKAQMGASPIADYRSNPEGFRLALDAGQVSFGYHSFGSQPARFSIGGRELTRLQSTANIPAALRGPRMEGLPITDFANSAALKLKGKPLPLQRYESSRSLAINADRSSFLIGSDWSLRLFSADGSVRWTVPAPNIVWAVNFSANDQLAVAAFGDGTIRWYLAESGKEILSFFPHADQKRWVLWTPEGYYDASPNGEELIGWHVNRGKNQAADFFPAAQFRDQFYRPDVISKVLNAKGSTGATRLVEAAAGRTQTTVTPGVVANTAPPVVELAVGGAAGEVKLAGDATSFTLRYRVRRTGTEPVSRVRLLVDGRPVTAEAPVPANDTALAEASVPLPSGPCVIGVLAENRSGAASVPATLRITRASAPPAAPASLKPRLYVLAVGVADVKMNDAFDVNGDGRVTEQELRLKDPQGTVAFADLAYADVDARDVAASFAAQEGLLYSKVETRVIVNKDATASAIRDGLDWIKAQTTARDVGVIFLSGHGENDNEGRFYFLSTEYDPKRRKSTGVSFSEIEETIKDPAGKMLFFIDSCHAGNALGKLFAAKGGGAVDINRLVNELSSAENGAIVFASSTGRQQSLESTELKHGVFAQAIIEGMNGKADLLHRGTINISGLEAYVCDRVKEYTEGQQTPTVAKPQTVPDFPIGIKR